MNQKINRYILLSYFLLLFPSNSAYIELPLKLYNSALLNNYTSKEIPSNSINFL